MGDNLTKITVPVVCIIAALVSFLCAAGGRFPYGNPQPTFGTWWRAGLAVLGLVFLAMFIGYFWWERASNQSNMTTIAKQAAESVASQLVQVLEKNFSVTNEIAEQIQDDIVERISSLIKDNLSDASEITKQMVSDAVSQLDLKMQMLGDPSAQMGSLFEERMSHFFGEKNFLAERFLPLLLRRCRAFAEEGREVYLLIDSGTTLYPFFEKLGKATVQAKQNQEKWVENLYVETNNLPGVEMLTRVGRVNYHNRYSPLAVKCELLPGTPLPVYAAPTGKKTNAALEQLRKDANSKAVFIALTTGNWVRIRRRSPMCPVPLARGRGHLDFKQALVECSDEIYVISPLGKIFTELSHEDVNEALGFEEGQLNPEKQSYNEVEINDEKARSVKLVSTYRSDSAALHAHSIKIRIILGMDHVKKDSSGGGGFFKVPIGDMEHIVLPYDNLPSDPVLQLDIEFPHEHTHDPDFMRKFSVSETVIEKWVEIMKARK
jgi:hypothetical protein